MMQYDQNMKPAKVEENLSWYDGSMLTIGGKGWASTNKTYERLPGKAEKIVRNEVWKLSLASAGIRIHFKTNSPSLAIRWDGFEAMNHMPATGVSGVDLYVYYQNKWQWLSVGRPTAKNNESMLFSDLEPIEREFILYLPLYNQVEKVLFGISHASFIKPAKDFNSEKPIVFYGTSITQGGCASRPGMAYPAILGRALLWPTINLGFSGNGKVEPEVIDLLIEIDAKIFVLDNLPNIEEPFITERLPVAIEKIRRKYPITPIVMIESIKYCDSFLKSARMLRYQLSNAAYLKVFKKYKDNGDKNLYYIEGDNLIGEDGEGTVDGVHMTDLGFLRFSQNVEPVLRKILN